MSGNYLTVITNIINKLLCGKHLQKILHHIEFHQFSPWDATIARAKGLMNSHGVHYDSYHSSIPWYTYFKISEMGRIQIPTSVKTVDLFLWKIHGIDIWEMRLSITVSLMSKNSLRPKNLWKRTHFENWKGHITFHYIQSISNCNQSYFLFNG